MTAIKKLFIFALFSVVSTSAWPRAVDFCKVTRSYDEKNLGAAPEIKYETCSGVAFLDYGKDLVKATCWPGAIDLLEGKCKLEPSPVQDEEVATSATPEIPASQLPAE